MPEIQNFVVTQVRTVKVEANSIEDAAILASLALEYGQDVKGKITPTVGTPHGMWGNTTSHIKITDLTVKKI